MRALTADTLSRVNKSGGEAPVLVIEVVLPAGSAYYSDRDLTQASIQLDGRVASAGELRTATKVDSGSRVIGVVGTMSVQLLDTDLVLKTFMDGHDLQGTSVNVYHWFKGQVAADMLLLLKGRIEQPPMWTEDGRSLDIEIETPRRIKPLPFAPTESDGLSVDERHLGKPWPMAFGTPSDVPAALVKEPANGTLVRDMNEIGVFQADGDLTVKVSESRFEIDNPDEDFPQTGRHLVRIGDEYVQGRFEGNTLIVLNRQVDRYSGLAVGGNGAILRLPAGVRAVGCYVTLHDNGVIAERGDTGISSHVIGSITLPSATSVIGGSAPFETLEAQVRFRGYCYKQVGRDCYIWLGNPAYVPEQVVADVNRYPWTPEQGAQWTHKAGTPVVVLDTPVKYVANQLPSESVVRVRAWRQVRRDDHTGYSKRAMVSVPEALYSVNLQDEDYNDATTITFQEKLSDRDAGWEDEVFVTVESSRGSNTADALAYLVNEQSEGHLVAGASFASVRTDLTKYPSNFAITDQRDLLDLIGDIAWQARCGVTWNGATATLVYLSKEPTTQAMVLSDATVAEGQVRLTSTRMEDVVTVFNATWRPNYSDPKPQRIMAQTNVARYGKREETYDFWIYQTRTLVKKSVDFWAARRGRIWRAVNVDTWGLEALGVDPLDYVKWSVTGFYSAVRGLVDQSSMAAWDHNQVGVILPIETGATTQSTHFWVSDSGDTSPTLPDYEAGAVESEVMNSPPPDVIVPASRSAEPEDPNQEEDTIFVVEAVEDENTDPSDPLWKTVYVRIKDPEEVRLEKAMSARSVRIAEIDFLDPSGLNSSMALERSQLEIDNASDQLALDALHRDLTQIQADNPSVSYMLTGDTGTMVHSGTRYIVSPDNAAGPHIGEVTKKKASPAEATLSADIAGGIKNGPQGAVQITILGDADPEVGDKILVFRDASGAYYTPGNGSASKIAMARVLSTTANHDSVPVGIWYTTNFDEDQDLTTTASAPMVASPYKIVAGLWCQAIQMADGNWVIQVPVVTSYVP